MALNGVKDNKCFEPVPTGGAKIIVGGTSGMSVPSDTSGEPAYQWRISNDAIKSYHVAIVTMQYDPYNSQAVYEGKLFIRGIEITDGMLSANIINTDTAAHAVTINYMVLGT